MPTDMGIQFFNGTARLYLKDPDGKFVPFTEITRITDITLPDNEAVVDTSVIDVSIPHEISFTIRLKRSPKALLRALGLPTKRRSMKAIGRPIRHIKRLQEKYRRDALKNGTDKKTIRCILKGSLSV